MFFHYKRSSGPNKWTLAGTKAALEQSWKEEKDEHGSEPWKVVQRWGKGGRIGVKQGWRIEEATATDEEEKEWRKDNGGVRWRKVGWGWRAGGRGSIADEG